MHFRCGSVSTRDFSSIFQKPVTATKGFGFQPQVFDSFVQVSAPYKENNSRLVYFYPLPCSPPGDPTIYMALFAELIGKPTAQNRFLICPKIVLHSFFSPAMAFVISAAAASGKYLCRTWLGFCILNFGFFCVSALACLSTHGFSVLAKASNLITILVYALVAASMALKLVAKHRCCN